MDATCAPLYGLALPPDVVRACGVPWPDRFGTVKFTDEALRFFETHDVEPLLARLLYGDYGLISGDAMDHQRNQKARESGRRFAGVYKVDGEAIYVAVEPLRGQTVVCTFWER